jgi:hypothetical protein
MESTAPHLDDPLPPTWRHWGGDRAETFFELFRTMRTQTSIDTVYPARELQMSQAAMEGAYVHYAAEAEEQALRLGYALARTADHRLAGIDAWYAAALSYARIVPMTPTESEAAYDRVSAFNAQDARHRGYTVNGQPPPERTEREQLIAIVHEIAERLAALED